MPPSGSLEVFMKLMKAWEYFNRMNKEGNLLARQEVEEAIALDPEYALLYSMLAGTHLMDVVYQSSESRLVSFAQANKNIKKALSLDDEDYAAHFLLGQLYWFSKERDKAIAAYERAIALNPNGSEAYAQLGQLLTNSGWAEEGLKLIQKALLLAPIPPLRYPQSLAVTYATLGRYEDAIQVYKQILKRSPDYAPAHIGLTAAYSASGRQEEARHQAQDLLRLDPSFSLDRWKKTMSVFIEDEARVEQIIANLRKAGLK
jgi:tetratricopeptide (TPR) repeat protein